jgi:hypothetical protein
MGLTNAYQAEDYPIVAIEYMVPLEHASKFNGDSFNIYTGTRNNEWVGGNSGPVKGIKMIADGKWHVGYVDFSDSELWTGNINILRIDTGNGEQVGAHLFIKSIKLLKEAPVDTNREDNTLNAARTWLTIGAENANGYAKSLDYRRLRNANQAVGGGNRAEFCFCDGGDHYLYKEYIGWFVSKAGESRYEYLIYEQGSKDETYYMSADAEPYWGVAVRTGVRRRADAPIVNYANKIGASIESAGFTIEVPLKDYMFTSGKTYKIVLRVITNDGKACLIGEDTFVYNANGTYLKQTREFGSAVDVSSLDAEEKTLLMRGWLTVKDNFSEIQYLVVDHSIIANDAQLYDATNIYYPYNKDSNSGWKNTNASIYGRGDLQSIAASYGADHTRSGYSFTINLSGLASGKVYSIYFRATTNTGNYAMFSCRNITL